MNMEIFHDGKIFTMKPERLMETDEVSIGDFILIERNPRIWNSELTGVYPLNKVTFPYFLQVKNISKGISTSMTCGNYGWNLDAIINAGVRKMIEIDFKRIK
jgi:hypothetical protein